MTTSWSKPEGVTTASRRLGRTGVNAAVARSPETGRAAAGPAGSAAAGATAAAARVPPSTITPEPAAAPLSTERRATALAISSCTWPWPVRLGSGWSQALPQRYWQVMKLRPPWRVPVGVSGSSVRPAGAVVPWEAAGRAGVQVMAGGSWGEGSCAPANLGTLREPCATVR